MPHRQHYNSVPWYDWSEWRDIYAQLYSNELIRQQHACNRIASWRKRCPIPIAVEGTASLVEMVLHEHLSNDEQQGAGQSTRSTIERQLFYACTIVRCVNGLVDAAQKGAFASAVSILAQRIGVPLWIVDLRHECTHNQLPSLSILSFAASYLISWFEENYWRKQEKLLKRQVLAVGIYYTTALMNDVDQCIDSREAKLQTIFRCTSPCDIMEELSEKLVFDVAHARDIAVRLLMDGEAYGISLETAVYRDIGLTAVDSPAPLYRRIKFDQDVRMRILSKAQSIWPYLTASLLSHTFGKFIASMIRNTEFSVTSDQDIVVLMSCVEILLGREWHMKLIQDMPSGLTDLYECGAQVLASLEYIMVECSPSLSPFQLDWARRLSARFRACKQIRIHEHRNVFYTFLKELQILKDSKKYPSGSKTQSPNEVSWLKLSVWVAAPLGMLYKHLPADSINLLEGRADVAAVSNVQGICESDGRTINGVDTIFHGEDTSIVELETAYQQNLTEIMNARSDLAEEVSLQDCGHTNRIYPRLKIQDVQTLIEIW